MPDLIEPDTERLRLRQWRPGDRAPFAAMNANAEVMEFFARTLTRADSDASAEAFEGMIVTSGWGFWAAESKAEHAFIGFVGIKPVPDDLSFTGAVEVGWRLPLDHALHRHSLYRITVQEFGALRGTP